MTSYGSDCPTKCREGAESKYLWLMGTLQQPMY